MIKSYNTHLPILILILISILIFTPPSLSANNLQIKNLTLNGQNPGAQFTNVHFDLSWENSWRLSVGPANWDAAWVFVKFRKNQGDWEHATLNYVNGTAASDGHTEPSGSTITTPSDGVGVFIYRDANGVGHVEWQDVQLRWNYGVDGVNNADDVEVRVFGIEMVYVPQGAFTVGAAFGPEIGRISSQVGPLQFSGYDINNESAITVAPGIGNLYYQSPAGEFAGDQLGPIPFGFPKGYNAFYCMKYEVSQQQWVDFFNTLTSAQKANNDITDLSHRGPNPIDRNEVDWEGEGDCWTEAPYLAMTFADFGDALAYLDWSGLRPMTELEYVKACRGPLNPVIGGYAWGTSKVVGVDIDLYYDLEEKKAPNESILNVVASIGNAQNINTSIFEDGPFRCGGFAASAPSATREETGATYYGIMEMTGNVYEVAVSIGAPDGRAYTANHGDGSLDAVGDKDVASWPPVTGKGMGSFGGSWFSPEETLMLNDRRYAIIESVIYGNDDGFRGVRSDF